MPPGNYTSSPIFRMVQCTRDEGTLYRTLYLLLTIPLILCCALPTSGISGTITKPNIILVFVDDVGYGDVGCYGSELFTPNIDKLAREGLRSTDCLVAANVCGPSRAALMTGRYPMRCGHPISRHNTPKYRKYGLAPDEVTIAELLKSAGYYNKMVGKWHLGFHVEGCHPLDAGFDEYLGLHGNYSAKIADSNNLYRNREIQEAKIAFEKVTELYTEEVVNFIKTERKAPFFVYFSHHIAHTPIQPRSEFKGKSKENGGIYGDFMLELDDSVGQVMSALKEAGISDNTLTIFLSDNGPARYGSAKPLQGGKYVTMEGGHRVPAIFHWPERIEAGTVSDALITSMDMVPLFCHISGVEPPIDRKLDGKNIFALLTGESEQSPHQYFYYYNGLNLQAIRNERWKLHFPRTPEDQPYWAKKAGANKKKLYTTLKQPLLFDLDSDISERRNVHSQNPKVVAELEKEAERVRKELGDVNIIGSDQRPHHLRNPNLKD